MTVKTPSLEDKYQILQQKIKAELVLALKMEECSPDELMLFLRIFSNVENYWELRVFLGVFEDQFKFLKKAEYALREIQKSEVEVFLKSKLPELLKTDPERVMEITKFAALPDVNLVKLFEQFAELKQ